MKLRGAKHARLPQPRLLAVSRDDAFAVAATVEAATPSPVLRLAHLDPVYGELGIGVGRYEKHTRLDRGDGDALRG